MWDGDKVCALAGPDLQEGVAGFGDDAPSALEDLVKTIHSEETTLRVPRAAKQYQEGGVVKYACPECGHVSEMSGFDEVIAYVCDGCGTGMDVEPFAVQRDDVAARGGAHREIAAELGISMPSVARIPGCFRAI